MSVSLAKPELFYVLIADGVVDQIVETEADMIRERADLRKMDCKVSVRSFDTYSAAQDYADWKEQQG